MQKDSFIRYAIKASKSEGRIFKEKESYIRSPYQRDRDRILHSAAFRRLKHKTQVFVNTIGDHFRTRLTHSLEVSQISRTISRTLNLNEDLTEALSLAHDLGHTPFGHAGEEILNECMNESGGFDHNIQTLRIVTLLEHKYYKYLGLNLTIETLDGLIKHNGKVYEVSNYDKILGKNFFKKKINFSRSPSLEAQIASISDDIAYNNHDLEDGVRAGLFSLSEMRSIPLLCENIKKHIKNKKNFRKEIIISQVIRDTINLMVIDVVNETKRNIIKNKIKTINQVYNLEYPIVNFSPRIKDFDYHVKDFLRERMYNNKKVLNKANKGKKIIKKLFNFITKNPKKFIRKELLVNKSKHRAVADFIAGMTDRFAINLYNRII